MDTLENYRQIIRNVLEEYVSIKYAYGEILNEIIFDLQRDRYLVMSVGWDGEKRVHGCLIHIDVIQGKVWIQRDGTEYGIAKNLVEQGIPANQIVIAFHPQDVRQYTEYAVQ